MAVNPSDVLRITAEMSLGADSVQNVHHYQFVSGGPITDAQALLDAAIIMETLYSLLIPQLATTYTFDQVRVQNITQGILLGSTAWPVLTVGGSALDILPFPTSALITYPTATPRTRGGTYYGGFTELGNAVGGSIIGALQTSLIAVAARALLQQNIAGNLYDFVLVNRSLGTVLQFTSAIIHVVWRTQRRRRQGVGS